MQWQDRGFVHSALHCQPMTAFLSGSILKPSPFFERRLSNFNLLNPPALIPDYSRCVGVDMEKACFIGVLFQVCGFDSSPAT